MDIHATCPHCGGQLRQPVCTTPAGAALPITIHTIWSSNACAAPSPITIHWFSTAA